MKGDRKIKAELIKDKKQWQQVLDRVTCDIYHTYEYVQLAARQENSTANLVVVRDNDAILCLPLVIRPIITNGLGEYYDAISPYGYPGPLISAPEDQDQNAFVQAALQDLVAFGRSKGIVSVFVRFHPLLSPVLPAFDQFGLLVAHGETVSIDLSLPEEEMWRQFRNNHRRAIGKLKRAGCEIVMDEKWEHLQDFIDIYRETMDRQLADEYYFFADDYFRELRDKLGEHIHLCTVKINGDIACAGLFTEINGIVQYHLSGTRNKYLHWSPLKLMLDHIRYWAKKRGNQVFHLGGGLGGQADSLFHFKAGFSNARHPFYTWRAITDEAAYSALVNQWELGHGCAADTLDGYFPAYRKC